MKIGRIDLSLGNTMIRDPISGRFLYGSERLKNSSVIKQEVRVNELEKMTKTVGKTPTNESLFELLWNFGPEINLRDKGSVGFLSNAYVVRALTERDVVIDSYGGKYLLWVADSSGLADGEPVTPAPVFVVGTKTLESESGETIAVPILYTLMESELRKAIFGTDDEVAAKPDSVHAELNTFRMWRDSTGKFEIEATLVTKDATQVVLKKRDGSVITVPFSKLCDSDQTFLKTN